MANSSSKPAKILRLTERELRIREAHEWCLHDPEIQRLYGGQFVVATMGKIWGVGKDITEAWEAAQAAGCPDQMELAYVRVPGLPM